MPYLDNHAPSAYTASYPLGKGVAHPEPFMASRITAWLALLLVFAITDFTFAQTQTTIHWSTLKERIASLEKDVAENVKHESYPEICPFESCEVHGDLLVKGVAAVEYGLFKAVDARGLALEEAAERFFPHVKVKVYGGCVGQKAKVEQVCYCPSCRLRLDQWLKAPTYVTRPRPLKEAFNDIRIGTEEKELFALMAPYRRLYSEHGQWQKWAEGHTIVFVTIWRSIRSAASSTGLPANACIWMGSMTSRNVVN
jgi:hypothetical protein